jgi:RNA polymerase sigma-70 factor, ECF subfamily
MRYDTERFQDASYDLSHPLSEKQIEELLGLWEKEHGQRIFWTIRRFVSREHDAEDVKQEFRIKVWHGLRDGKAPLQSPGKWLMRIAVNVAIDFLRKRRFEKRCRKPFDESGAGSFAVGPAAEREREATERMIEALLVAVASLDPSKKRFVNWRFFDGVPVEEIAARLSVHVNTVGKRRKRVLQRLCQELQPLRQELEDLGVEFLPLRSPSVRKKSRSS